MLPNALNLMEPEKKNRLQKLIYHIFVKDILEMTLIVCALLASTLLWGYLIMIDEFADLAQSSTLVSRTYSAYNQEVKKTNQLIRQARMATEGYADLTPQFLELAEGLPGDIELTSLEFDRHAGLLTITGVAKTRSALLNYQKNLGRLDWLGGIESPLSQLLQKENVNFQFKAALKNFPPLSQPNL